MRVKSFLHIKKTVRLLLPGICLFIGSVSLQAQTDDDSAGQPGTITVPQTNPPPADIMVDPDPDENEKPEGRFQSLGEQDSLPYQVRQLPPGYTEDLKKKKDFWYADETFKKEVKKEEEKFDADYTPFMQRTWVQTLLWIIMIGGFAFAIMWYLADSQVGLFRKRKVAIRDISNEEGEIPEDIFAIQYQKEIDKALAKGNYRLAVRIHYLRLIRNLADQEIIRFKHEKTNLDYLMEVSSKSWYHAFFRLTRHFEYSWYGHFEVNGEMYEQISAEFSQFEKRI